MVALKKNEPVDDMRVLLIADTNVNNLILWRGDGENTSTITEQPQNQIIALEPDHPMSQLPMQQFYLLILKPLKRIKNTQIL